MTDLRAKVIRLAHARPELRAALLPLLKQAATQKQASNALALALKIVEPLRPILTDSKKFVANLLSNVKDGSLSWSTRNKEEIVPTEDYNIELVALHPWGNILEYLLNQNEGIIKDIRSWNVTTKALLNDTKFKHNLGELVSLTFRGDRSFDSGELKEYLRENASERLDYRFEQIPSIPYRSPRESYADQVEIHGYTFGANSFSLGGSGVECTVEVEVDASTPWDA